MALGKGRGKEDEEEEEEGKALTATEELGLGIVRIRIQTDLLGRKGSIKKGFEKLQNKPFVVNSARNCQAEEIGLSVD